MARTQFSKTCIVCHVSFVPRKLTQTTCSNPCRSFARRTRVEQTCPICQTVFLVEPHRFESGRGKYCSRACHNASQRIQDFPAHFWSQVDKSGGPDACWPWKGNCYPNGYGRITVARKGVQAHRIAYELTYGPIPPGKMIRHRCDNPPCCNVFRCLLLGLQKDNIQDALDRGRWPVGERHHNGTLTTKLVLRIRRLKKQGLTARAIAQRLHVTIAPVYAVLQGKTWKHLK